MATPPSTGNLGAIDTAKDLVEILEWIRSNTTCPNNVDPRAATLIEAASRFEKGIQGIFDEADNGKWTVKLSKLFNTRGEKSQRQSFSVVCLPSGATTQGQKPYLAFLFSKIGQTQATEEPVAYFVVGAATSQQDTKPGRAMYSKPFANPELFRRRDVLIERGLHLVSSRPRRFVFVEGINHSSDTAIGWNEIDKSYAKVIPFGYKYDLSRPLTNDELRSDIRSLISMYQEAKMDEVDFSSNEIPNQAGTITSSSPSKNLNASENVEMQFFDLLRNGCRAFIFAGPPGVGKTFLANKLSQKILIEALGQTATPEEVSRHRKVLQFHPAYSYEDFVEGLRPNVTDSGHVVFNVEPGHLLETIGTRDDHLNSSQERSGSSEYKKFIEFIGGPEKLKELISKSDYRLWDFENDRKTLKPFFFIIDEINRANVSRVFGELLVLLEGDKRGNPMYELQLSASKKHFSIPPHIIFIGTMNTSDRSIKSLDAAFLRRFAYLNIPVDYALLEAEWLRVGADARTALSVKQGLQSMNEDISNALNNRIEDANDRLIGPSYFLPDAFNKEFNSKFVSARMEFQVRPVLTDLMGTLKANPIVEKYKNVNNWR